MTNSLLVKLLMAGMLALHLTALGVRSAQEPAKPAPTTAPEATTKLTLGKSVPRELKGGQSHTYTLQLKANEYVYFVAEQKGVDVVVRLFTPSGEKLAEVDSPNGTQGPEPLRFIAATDGNYRIEVASLEAKAPLGKYEARLEENRPATERDKALVEAETVANKVEQLRGAGRYAEAIPFAERALALREKLFNAEHSEVATSLNNLAELYYYKGDYAKAEPLYQRVLAIRERVLGAEHPDVATSLNDLAVIYWRKGDFATAEPLSQRALAIREKVLGMEHPDVALLLNNLAVLYKSKGDYAKAEPLYQRALAIREKALGTEHPDIAISLNNLAVLYENKGDYAKAEPLSQRALAIQEKVLGAEHPDVATSLNNLAVLYENKGDFAKAEPLYQRALAIREKVLGAGHPNVADSLNNLAMLYRSTGDYAKAEPLYQRALVIRGKVLGGEHQDVADSLNNLALLYYDKNDYAKAEPLFQRALAILEKVLGIEHPKVAKTLNNLSRSLQAEGKLQEAIAFQIRSNEARERDFMRNLNAGSERQKQLYLNLSTKNNDQTLSLHLQAAPTNLTIARAALTEILRRKGRPLDAMVSSIEAIRRHAAPEDQKLLDELTAAKSHLSTLTLRGPGKEGIEPHQAQLKKLEATVDNLEARVSQQSAEYRAQTQPVTLEAVQQAIPRDVVLVEFATYRPYDPKPRKLNQPHYAAYLLSHSGEPKWAELGETEPIDRLVAEFRQGLQSSGTRRNLAFPTSTHSPAQLETTRELSSRLYQAIFKPLEPHLGTTRRVLLSPDGKLNLIPFAALVDDHGQYLVKRYTLTYLTSGRDLLRLNIKIASLEPPLIVADPDYGKGQGPIMLGKQLGPLARLQGTGQEGKQIHTFLPDATLRVRSEATKQSLEAVNRPAILHIATHGYFLADAPPQAPAGDQRTLRLGGDLPPINLEKVRQENPLLRSCLFFAGANQRISDKNDGTMTALEAANLDLWGTKLVVLSACDTGVGDVPNGEGVYGMRRALVLAGSETQVMSLWSVSDAATRELMVGYYRRLKAGEGRADALRAVQLEMLSNPKRRHPYFWASFIQSGEWANLDGKR